MLPPMFVANFGNEINYYATLIIQITINSMLQLKRYMAVYT